jgi:hypothetical protein
MQTMKRPLPKAVRNLFIQLHLYAGLACFPYFIIFGISSLNINHDFAFMKPSETTIRWQKRLAVPDLKDNQQLADNMRDSLGLMGWAPYWEQEKGPELYAFTVTHPGKDYTINAFLSQNRVEVTEKSKGFWPVFNSLHFLGGDIPNAPVLINMWQYYQNLSVVVMLFSMATGIYLFLKRKQERTTGLLFLFGSAGLSFLFMLFVWLWE